MKKLYLSLLAGAVMFGAQAGTTWTIDGTDFSVDTICHATVGPGITETHIKVKNSSYSNNLFYTTIDLQNPNLELRGVQAKDEYGKTESVKAMGDRMNRAGNGQYITGVNSDFFDMGSAFATTCGYSVVDGKIINAQSNTDGWSSYAVVGDKKDISFSEIVAVNKIMKFPNGNKHIYRVNPEGRYDNYLCIYTPAFGKSTGTNMWGAECTMKLVSGSLENNDAVFEITSPWVGDCSGNPAHGNMEIPADGFVLSGVGDARLMVNKLNVGDKVSLEGLVKVNGKEVNARQILGGCPLVVINGELAPTANFSRIDHFSSRQARTMIGLNKDNTKLILLVDDKYTTNKNTNRQEYAASAGFVLKTLANVMIKLGCENVMNFDGGGSSQLYVKGLGIRNIPYGEASYLRPVANGFFAVSTTPEDNTVATIEVRQKNVRLATGEKFTPVVYGYNKYGVLVNTNVTDFTVKAASEIGTVSGKTLTAGSGKYSTQMVVTSGTAVCGVNVFVNGGGTYVKSGDVPEVTLPYEPEQPGEQEQGPELTEKWKYFSDDLNDGWDGTAPNWTSADAVKAKSCPRFAIGKNGKLYTVNMKTMSIAEITAEGVKDVYKLPSLEGRSFNNVPDYYGSAISMDDAGNFLIGHLFTKAESSTVWTIFNPADGKYKHFDLGVPEGMRVGRIDCVGRVIGDLTRKAMFYIAPLANLEPVDVNEKVRIVTVTGDGNAENVTVESTFSPFVYQGAAHNQIIAQPKFATVEEALAAPSIYDTFYMSSCSGNGQWSRCYSTFENGQADNNFNVMIKDVTFAATNGFDSFVLDGKRYFVRNYMTSDDYTDANKCTMNIAVIDQTGVIVAKWENPDYTSGSGYSSISTEIIDAKNANIYVYNSTGKVNGLTTGAGAAAVLRFSLGKVELVREPGDVTPEGLKFDEYEDGTPFILTAAPVADGASPWSCPAYTYRDHFPNAFDENGQLTVLLFRGQTNAVFNNQANVDAQMQKNVAVRHVNDAIGNCLVINEAWSPGASTMNWPGVQFSNGVQGVQPQFSFYMDPTLFNDAIDQRHYVRVRFVYNVLLRGCHYYQDVNNGKDLKIIKGIYATHDGNWVVPENDATVGGEYAETGINFARWQDETNNVNDIPENPVVADATGKTDPWDLAHGVEDPNGGRAYIMNPDRFRVYEFDTYLTPGEHTVSVQLNIADRNVTYLIKEITFTDLGTDASKATLLSKRQLGWKYFAKSTDSVDDINIDTPSDDNVLPVYYNLQGVRVENPGPGLYIVVRGSKVTKELIR